MFRGVAQGKKVVNIRIPNGGINLTRVGGTETILLNAFTLDGQSKRTMAQAGVFDLQGRRHFAADARLRSTASTPARSTSPSNIPERRQSFRQSG